MSLLKFIFVGLSVAFVSTAAVAFQEQQHTAPAPAPEPAKPVELAPLPGASSGSTGTEVRIPGLGKLGNLPKMDFGLELLYGATAQTGPRDDKQDSGAQIRGTLKYRFPN